MNEEHEKLIGCKFRHFKGKLYRLEGFAKDSETLEEMVVYRALYGDGGLWVRPAKMFFETIERDGKRMKRFELQKGKEMKKNLGKKNWMFPMPVLMIGTYGEDDTPDVMNAAWGGITLEDEITICIDTSHKTWANIAARKAFTVAFGTADKVAACDYLGLVSGNKTPDKVTKSGLTVTKSKFVDAPVINELPLVLECELVSMNDENCNVVGKIVNCAVEEAALTDGKPDAAKMKPICFDPCAHVYRIMGDAVANAFSVGKSLNS